jgi:holo-[acyl-carrier protein] synthase
VILGVGVDLVDIARVEDLIASRGDRALARLFTPQEVAYAMSRAQPYVHLAARIAAKEAAYKALSSAPGGGDVGKGGAIAWRDMEVVSDGAGRPGLVLHGAAGERAEDLGVTRVWLTLSHSRATAGAVVILERV